MRIDTKLWMLLIVLIICPAVINAQSDNFDMQTYKAFLSTHKDLSSEQLQSLHPAGVFRGNLKTNFSFAFYNDSVRIKYKLTPDEISLIEKNGFMVTERHRFLDFSSAFGSVYNNDLPVFISADAILDAIHRSCIKIMKTVEVKVLIPKLTDFLKQLHSQMPALSSAYSSDPKMDVMLKDLDIYLTVARKLLDNTAAPYYSSNSAFISELLGYIEAAQPQDVSLFSDSPKTIDFSQFTPRSYYTDPSLPQLAKYFKTMMWLGRIEIYLMAPRARYPQPKAADIQRQTVLAALILEAVQKSNTFQLYKDIDGTLQFFVGESDNVTLNNLQTLTQDLNIQKADQLLDNSVLQKFQDTLKTKSYAFQRILSQIIMTGFNDPDSIVPASAFLLLGQRFIIDSYVTGQVVFDRIKYNGVNIKRMLPSSQDVLFALGNDASAQLLKKELDKYHYGSNLAALRYLTDSYGTDFWDLTFYNMWLNSLRKLNPPEDRTKLPPFMQTGAFWQEKMNTQLSSWAQLRHDFLLYAKQSYSGAAGCSYPMGYVEPFPEFYKQLKLFADRSKDYFQKFDLTGTGGTNTVADYFGHLSSVSDTLLNISVKELNNTPLDDNENRFIKSILSYKTEGCSVVMNGWYVRLSYNSSMFNSDNNCFVADIHTAPTNESGDPVGWVMHVGTGPVNLGVFLVPGPDNTLVACTGPVMSYHEYLTSGFKRLTDAEWERSFYSQDPPVRPDFVNVYLADKSGQLKPEGASLVTSIDDNKDDPQLPESIILSNNYPNPFNSTTMIRFTIPYNLSHQRAKLTVYDIRGQVVKELVNEDLPSGTYLSRWDGTNVSGSAVTSGVYFYNISVGEKSSSGKMSLIK